MRFKYWFLETGDLNAFSMVGDKADAAADRPQKMPDKDVLEVPGENRRRKVDPRLRKFGNPPKLVRKDEVE